MITYWEHTEYILSTYWVHIKNRTDWVQDVECNCLMVNHTAGSLFSCQSGCNRWPHTFLNSLMIDTISTWLNIHNIFSGAQFESDSSHRGPTAQVQAVSKNVSIKPLFKSLQTSPSSPSTNPTTILLGDLSGPAGAISWISTYISWLIPPSSSQRVCPHLQRPPRPNPKKQKKKNQQQRWSQVEAAQWLSPTSLSPSQLQVWTS